MNRAFYSLRFNDTIYELIPFAHSYGMLMNLLLTRGAMSNGIFF